jgi:hypothetical protein
MLRRTPLFFPQSCSAALILFWRAAGGNKSNFPRALDPPNYSPCALLRVADKIARGAEFICPGNAPLFPVNG